MWQDRIHAPKVAAIQNLEVAKWKKDVLGLSKKLVRSFILLPILCSNIRAVWKDFPWSEVSHQHHANLLIAKLSVALHYSCNASSYEIIHSPISKRWEWSKTPHNKQKLSKCQEHYATTEKEAYAIIFALKKSSII